jgi:hypothetical protein
LAFGENRKDTLKTPRNQKSADYLSLIDLGQIKDFQITGSEAGFIQKIHAIRNKCLRDFTVDEVRACLAQDIGAVYLAQKALGFLETNPWIEAEHYEGDLLNACIDISDDYWKEEKDNRERMRNILQAANEKIAMGKFSPGRKEIRDLERGFRKFELDTEQIAVADRHQHHCFTPTTLQSPGG